MYTYTQANRLVAITANDLNWSAAYNGDGARMRQTVNSVPTTYTQDLATPLPVVLQAKTGVTTMQYLFDMGTRPLAEYDTMWEYLLPDGLGSQGSASSIFGQTRVAHAARVFLRLDRSHRRAIAR